MNGELTIRGRSLGGIYTSVYLPELSTMFDVGVALRENIGARYLCLSHGHVDHVGALPAFVGMRGLFGQNEPLTIFCPKPIVPNLEAGLKGFQQMQGYDLNVKLVGMSPGDEQPLGKRHRLRAFKTYHPAVSLGYAIYEPVKKLKTEFKALSSDELRRRRLAEEPIFDETERYYFAYATDTLPEVLKHEPWLMSVRELMLECTFLDDRKSVANARRGGHIHLDELRPYLPQFTTQRLHLMHFSQLYSPGQVRAYFSEPWVADLSTEIRPLLPVSDSEWWH